MADPVKISIKRSEDVATVVERLIDVDTDAVIFSIPPGALFGQALANFKLLKREASLLAREVIIETSDLEIRERAAKAGLGIIEASVVQDDESVSESASAKARVKRGRPVKVRVVSEGKTKTPSRSVKKTKEDIVDEEEEAEAVRPSFSQVMANRPRKGEPTKPNKSSHRRLFTWIGVGAGLACIVLGYVAIAVLPTANILVVTQKKSWEFDGVLSIDKSVAQIDLAGSKVPGQLFVVRDSVTKRVPATGKQYVSKKATAVLTVFNAYSSQPQNVVANTRFVTPDGIIFRSTSALTIPGAKIENGKIIASSIDISVTADKPGVASNVGPVAKLTIPGFKNTPKYEGFYGTLKEGASGGFVGETSVPTEKDVAVAKEQGTKTVSEQLQNKITASVPPEFTVLAGATKFVVLKQTVQSQASSDGTVGVVTEGQLSILAFREQDVKSLLSLRLRKDIGAEFKFDNDELAYGTLNQKAVVVGSGHMLVPMTYTANLSYDVKVEDVQNKVIGKPLKDINLLLLELNGISGGKASLSPFYVRTVPENLNKIKVTIE